MPDDGRAVDRLARPPRHAAPDAGAGAAERHQERPQMVHHHMLDAMQKEHVLRPVVEPRLQHRIDRGEAADKADAAPDRRPLPGRGRRQTAAEPQQHQRRRQIFGRREIPRHPERHQRRMARRQPPKEAAQRHDRRIGRRTRSRRPSPKGQKALCPRPFHRQRARRAAPVCQSAKGRGRSPGSKRGAHHPHTSRAVSTTRRSLARCSSIDSALPSTVEENPHCG